MSNFKKDLSIESNIHQYLRENLYWKLKNMNKLHYFISSGDREMQVKGLDVTLKYTDGRVFKVDEKSAVYHFYNGVTRTRKLPTFVLEIGFLNKEEVKEGWLISDKYSETVTYLFNWIESKPEVTEPWNLTKDNIVSVDSFLVRKDVLLKYLEDKFSLSKEVLKQISQYFYKNPNLQNLPHSKRWRYSEKISEKPLNFLLQKNELQQIAEEKYIVRKDGLFIISGAVVDENNKIN